MHTVVWTLSNCVQFYLYSIFSCVLMHLNENRLQVVTVSESKTLRCNSVYDHQQKIYMCYKMSKRPQSYTAVKTVRLKQLLLWHKKSQCGSWETMQHRMQAKIKYYGKYTALGIAIKERKAKHFCLPCSFLWTLVLMREHVWWRGRSYTLISSGTYLGQYGGWRTKSDMEMTSCPQHDIYILSRYVSL